MKAAHPSPVAVHKRVVGVLRAAGKRGLSDTELRRKVGVLIEGVDIVLEELVAAGDVALGGTRRGRSGETQVYIWKGDAG